MTQHVARSKLFMLVLLIIAAIIAARVAKAQVIEPGFQTTVWACREDIASDGRGGFICNEPIVDARFTVRYGTTNQGGPEFRTVTDRRGIGIIRSMPPLEPAGQYVQMSLCVDEQNECVYNDGTLYGPLPAYVWTVVVPAEDPTPTPEPTPPISPLPTPEPQELDGVKLPIVRNGMQ